MILDLLVEVGFVFEGFVLLELCDLVVYRIEVVRFVNQKHKEILTEILELTSDRDFDPSFIIQLYKAFLAHLCRCHVPLFHLLTVHKHRFVIPRRITSHDLRTVSVKLLQEPELTVLLQEENLNHV